MSTARTFPHSLFAVWHWPRWTRAILIPICLILYLASYEPMIFFSMRLFDGDLPLKVTLIIYKPVYWLHNETRLLDPLFDWQLKFLVDHFGHPWEPPYSGPGKSINHPVVELPPPVGYLEYRERD